MDYLKLGTQVKVARRKKGITQARLAEMLGYSTQHISHVETGSTKLSVESLVELSNVLEVSVDELLKDSLYNQNAGGKTLSIKVRSLPEEELVINVVRELQKGLENFKG